jgi:hypothetical protein
MLLSCSFLQKGGTKGGKGKKGAKKGEGEEGVELTPEEKEAKAKLRIEALERELGIPCHFSGYSACRTDHHSPSTKNRCYESIHASI